MSRKTRRGRSAHHLRDIGLPEPQPKRCGNCAFCKGLKQCQHTPDLGQTKELAAVFTLKHELQPIQFRRLSEFHDAACVDLGDLLLVYFPIWLQPGLIPAILDDVGKILDVSEYRMVNGCG